MSVREPGVSAGGATGCRARAALLTGLVAAAGCQTVVSFETPREQGIQCADGVDNDANGLMDCADTGCAVTVACLGCGDGTVDIGEECDDGNLDPQDGCGPGCVIERCGDGVVHAGEACDDGNLDDADGCLAGCVLAGCGDGVVRTGVEQCDDANAGLGDGCTPACVTERCGDGIVQAGPVITGVELAWLASSCAPGGQLQLQINGQSVVTVSGDLPQTCTCAPPNGFQSTFTEVPPLVNGPHTFSIALPGADQFLGWAVLVLSGGPTPREIVLYEGAPGAATSRVTAMCSSGGFDDNIVGAPITVTIPTNEECDDGNTVDGDGCESTCRTSP